MNWIMNHTFLSLQTNQSSWLNSKRKEFSYETNIRVHRDKRFSHLQIIEICCLVFILLEHGLIFIITFQRKPLKKRQTKNSHRSIFLPSKSFLYSCLHRNWIRAFSFSNVCLSCVCFVTLMLKHYHPNLVHHSSITFYSLPLNLLQQMLINFSTFHLFIITISVLQYFIRYYRLLKNTYSSYFFNGKNLLLTKHTNVALILTGSLALIFAYNFIFYTPKAPQTISLLPLITFNMILLPLINSIIFVLIFICLLINYFYQFNPDDASLENEQESLRLVIEKNTCIKCYSKILEKNPNLFQDKNYSYRNLYKIFFSARLHTTYPFQIQEKHNFNPRHDSSQLDFPSELEGDSENDATNKVFFRTLLVKLHRQNSLCHLSHFLLLILLFKYILLTFPQHILQMLFHVKQFYQFILKRNLTLNLTYSLYQDNENLIKVCHYLFLLSRFCDSFFLIRWRYLIKKYFPCWCHCNSHVLRREKTLKQALTINMSRSSCSESKSAADTSNMNDVSNETKEKSTVVKQPNWKLKQHRFRVRFQFIPLWSNARPRLFQERI